jgi:sigma-B regulation protein RsbU (phosphoserine phosphatase)
MAKTEKSRSGFKGSITLIVVVSLLINTVLILLNTLIVSGLFFFKQATAIYDDLNKSIVGEAYSQIDTDLIKDLANTCHGVFRGIDKPKELFGNDKDAYYKRFAEISNNKKYTELQEKLKKLCAGTQASEIDMVIIYPKDEIGIYIVDAREVELINCGELFEIPLSNFDENGVFKGFYSNSRFFGKVWTSGTPVYNDEEKGFCVYMTADIPTSVINGKVADFVLRLTLISLGLSVIVSMGIVFTLRRHLVRPVKEISGLAESFIDGYEKRMKDSGKSDVFGKLQPGKVEEINVLINSMQKMEGEMNGYIDDLKTATAERERISTELDLAAKIQAAMLPSQFPPFPDRNEFSIFASMTPAKEVGGDFYDFYLIDDDHLALVIADVSGKGIPGALFMMVTKIIIKNYAMMGNSPAKILELLNNQICSNNSADMFVTVWMGILTISEGKITAASAGHEYPYIKQGTKGFEVLKDKHGFVIGGMEEMKYKEYEIQLNKGDTLFLYTDGLVEATNSDEEMFGAGRALRHLNEKKDASPEEILVHMDEAVKSFVGDAEQFDDLTMLAIKLSE